MLECDSGDCSIDNCPTPVTSCAGGSVLVCDERGRRWLWPEPVDPYLAQYRALAQLCQALKTRYPIDHIAGHEHIAPGRKRDPGPGFDWALLQQSLAWDATAFPPPYQSTPDAA